MKSPAAGMNVSSVPATTPGKRERQGDPQERLPLACIEILRRLDQPPVDLLERDVQRQGHEGQEVVGDARDHGRRRREQASTAPEHAEQVNRAQGADDETVVGEDRLPGERPDQIRDKERRDDEEEQQVLPAPAAKRDPVRNRIADQERKHRCDARVFERADEVPFVVPDCVPVVPPGPAERVAEVERARFERLVSEKPEWDEEENGEPEHAGREQEVRRQPPMPMQARPRPQRSPEETPARDGTKAQGKKPPEGDRSPRAHAMR